MVFVSLDGSIGYYWIVLNSSCCHAISQYCTMLPRALTFGWSFVDPFSANLFSIGTWWLQNKPTKMGGVHHGTA